MSELGMTYRPSSASSLSHPRHENLEQEQLLKKSPTSYLTVQCKFCNILLHEKDEYLGHMIHSHELNYQKLLNVWNSLLRA